MSKKSCFQLSESDQNIFRRHPLAPIPLDPVCVARAQREKSDAGGGLSLRISSWNFIIFNAGCARFKLIAAGFGDLFYL
jgi:hypothetical protein